MTTVSVRAARPRDAAAIADIHVRSWRDAYASILEPGYLAGPVEADRLALWVGRLAQPPPKHVMLVAEAPEEQVIGFVCAHRDEDKRWGSWIDNLHVVPTMRGFRVGERLLGAVADMLRSQGSTRGVYLWVFEANARAVRFYERLGGRVVGSDRSRIPAAGGKTILRVHWPGSDDIRRDT